MQNSWTSLWQDDMDSILFFRGTIVVHAVMTMAFTRLQYVTIPAMTHVVSLTMRTVVGAQAPMLFMQQKLQVDALREMSPWLTKFMTWNAAVPSQRFPWYLWKTSTSNATEKCFWRACLVYVEGYLTIPKKRKLIRVGGLLSQVGLSSGGLFPQDWLYIFTHSNEVEWTTLWQNWKKNLRWNKVRDTHLSNVLS